MIYYNACRMTPSGRKQKI